MIVFYKGLDRGDASFSYPFRPKPDRFSKPVRFLSLDIKGEMKNRNYHLPPYPYFNIPKGTVLFRVKSTLKVLGFSISL